MNGFYPAKLIYQTHSVAVGRHDWAISVFSDGSEITVIPQWRFPGEPWRFPAELKSNMPAAALSAILEPATLLKLARAIETAIAATRIVP